MFQGPGFTHLAGALNDERFPVRLPLPPDEGFDDVAVHIGNGEMALL